MENLMAIITLRGEHTETYGDLPNVGEKAFDFTLVDKDLGDVSLSSFAGKKVVLNIFPSIDTPVCATSVRKFNADAGKKENTIILCVSADLSFALGRFCGAEGIDNVVTLSTFRDKEFGEKYGVLITTGPLRGLLSRAVVVIGDDGIVKYREQVKEIGEEPDYEAALAALDK